MGRDLDLLSDLEGVIDLDSQVRTAELMAVVGSKTAMKAELIMSALSPATRMRILILGASGSGTTTLGSALAKRWSWQHLDLDDYYWLPSSPPFQEKRHPAERLRLLSRDLESAANLVVSGSLLGWGEQVEEAFDHIVFLRVPTEIRLDRLRTRELQRYGLADAAFLEWAAQYDEGPPMGRSLGKHLAWLARRKCPVLRIEGDTTVEHRVHLVGKAIRLV